MFHKITVSKEYADLNDLNKGQGFYLVKTNLGEDLQYVNPSTNFWITLEPSNNLPKEFLDLFESGIPEKEDVVDDKLKVSENFILKAMAMSKANSQSIKITDIIKD